MPQQGHSFDGMTPIFYEADIRPGQSVVMPGFTISVEAPRGAQQTVMSASQPVVTVMPAGDGGQLRNISDAEFVRRHDQEQRQQQQQQHTSEHHPLAGIIRDQRSRSGGGSEKHDLRGQTPSQQVPAVPSHPQYPGAVGSSSQQVEFSVIKFT